jgi:hypothetical protein
VCHRLDYTATPPTITFTRYAAATEVDLVLPANAIEVDVKPRGDQAYAGVILQYKQTHTLDDETKVLIAKDAYPLDASPTTPRTILATFDFAGEQIVTQKQYVGVRNIDSTSETFWKRHLGWVRDLDAGFTITSGAVTPVEDDDEHTYSKYIYQGSCPNWLSDMVAPVEVTAVLNGVLNGRTLTNYELRARITGTRLTASGTYSRVTSNTVAEVLPTGLAQAVYAAASIRHHEGMIVFRHADVWTAAPRVGDVVNVPAKAAWASMKAQVQSVELQLDSGTVAITVGPPKHLSVQDVVEWFRRARQTTPGNRGGTRSTGAMGGGTDVNGSVLGPDSSAIAPPFTTEETAWQLRADGSIVPGTINPADGDAQIPLIGTTPISGGATVPKLTIPATGYLVAEFTFSITWNGGYLGDPTTLTSMKFACLSSVTADNPATGKFYKAFASITDGVPSAPFYTNANLTWKLCGNVANQATLTLT